MQKRKIVNAVGLLREIVAVLPGILTLAACLLFLFFAASAKAGEDPVELTSYDELNANLTAKDGTNWFNPGSYEIKNMGAASPGFIGNLGLSDGVELKVLQVAPLRYSPLVIKEGDFNQTGGYFKLLPLVTSSGMAGLYIEKGGYNLSGGTLDIIDVSNIGIRLDNGNFTVSGGTLSALTRSDTNHAIVIVTGDFIQNGGRVNFTSEKPSSSSMISSGLSITDGSFRMNGCDLTADGKNGYGIYLFRGDFIHSGGNIRAQVDDGDGIFINRGRYEQAGGTLWLSPTEKVNSRAIHISNFFGNNTDTVAEFKSGALVRPILDLRNGAAANWQTDSGLIYIHKGSALIDPNAQLNPWVDNSLGLAKGDKTDPIRFLATDDDAINGKFADPVSSLTLKYTYDTSNPQYHALSVERTAMVSEVLSSRNAPVVQYLEDNAAWLLANPDNPFAEAYTLLDLSITHAEADRQARGFSPWGATGLAKQANARMDMAQTALSGILKTGLESTAKTGRAAAASSDSYASLAAAPNPGRWLGWVTPLARYDSYDAKTGGSGDTDGWAGGVAAGFARRFNGGTLGMGLHYIHGKQDGDGYTAKSDTFGVTAGFRATSFAVGPWFELGGGYAYSDVDQDRLDLFANNHESDIDQHTLRLFASIGQDFSPMNCLRLTPSVGFDYTGAKQDSFTERSAFGNAQAEAMNLSVGGDTLHSYRPKIGGEVEYRASNAFSFTGHAFYRYELGDRNADLSVDYVGTPIRFRTEGDKYNRSSANIGAGDLWRVTDRASIGLQYDLTLGDKYQGHQVDLTFGLKF